METRGSSDGLAAPSLDSSIDGVHADIERYYTQKVLTHGATAHGVDWTCQPTQELRFVQLLKLCNFRQAFTLNDIGCGYGALLAFLAKRHRHANVDYLGTDLSRAMIDRVKPPRRSMGRSQFIVTSDIPRVADYSVASGIFNVKLMQPADQWDLFIKSTMAKMNAASRLGFAVNFLVPPEPDMQAIPELYHSSPETWVRYCENQFGTKVELLEQYGMREFTLLVRKP